MKVFKYIEHTRHLFAYEYASKYSIGKVVVDVGCSNGYGCSLLSQKSSYVVGVDINPEVLRVGVKSYNKFNQDYVQADARLLPFRSSSFDVVTSFQVIEHMNPKNDVILYLSEMHRVLKKEVTR